MKALDSDIPKSREPLSFFALVIIVTAAVCVMIIIVSASYLEPGLPPFCPIDNRQFEKMTESVWNTEITPGSYCMNSIAVHFKNFDVGQCHIDCDRRDWLGVDVSCPFSLVGLKYKLNNTNYTRCQEGNFTMTFFAQLGNIVDVASIQVHDYEDEEYDRNNAKVNWLTYLARKGAFATVKKVRVVGGKFQFVNDNGIIEEPDKYCYTNPFCHHSG